MNLTWAELFVVAVLAVLVYLIQRWRLLTNEEIEGTSVGKVVLKVKSLSYLSIFLYAGREVGSVLILSITAILLVFFIGAPIMAVSSFIPGITEIPKLTIFEIDLEVVNLGIAVIAGFLGPDRSLWKLSDRVLLGEAGSKEIWRKRQEEKLRSPMDIEEENGDNEREDTH